MKSSINILPRIKNVTSFIQRNELENIKPEDKPNLPERILRYSGSIRSISFPQQGMCSLVSIITGDNGKFILKTAKGNYRGKELYSEYLVTKELKGSSIPVPLTYDFFQEGNLFYLLRECSEGIPLNTLFIDNKDKTQRLHMISEMACALSKIHKIKTPDFSFENFIDAQLFFAEKHLKNSTIDLGDFVFKGKVIEPEILLSWLKKNKPNKGTVCLIHGDYRPKNILWSSDHITSIVDWAFCDIGDPYYDFAILSDYFQDNDEKDAFTKSYGIEHLDEERLEYYYKMIPFINI